MAQLRLAREPKCCLLLLHSVSKVHPQLQLMPREPFFLSKRSLKGHHIYCLQLDSTEVHYQKQMQGQQALQKIASANLNFKNSQ